MHRLLQITLTILLLVIAKPVYSQNYELYTGVVISEQKVMEPGYVIGVNWTAVINKDRKYLQNMIFGFEHLGYMSKQIQVLADRNVLPTQPCNCEFDNLTEQPKDYKYQQQVRAVALNAGVEIYKNWWLIGGVTNFQHILKIDNNKVSEYRSMQIDAGVKKFIKINEWYLVPMFKANPEVMIFGIGFAM